MNIDRIARAMVDVEPSADLEARIRARIGAAAPERRADWLTWRVAVPLGAIASLALAFIVVQGPGSRVQGPESSVQAPIASAFSNFPSSSVPQLPSSPAPQLPSSPAPQLPSSPAPQLPSSPARQLASSPAPQLSAEEIAWMERRIPALDPVIALQMDRLRVDSIQPEPLAITPLTMTMLGADGAGIERNER